MSKASKTIRYSEGERRALDALRSAPERRLTTLELVERVYEGEPPFHARHSIAGTMRSLAAKAERNGERFLVKKSARAGSKPATFTLEKRT